MAVEVNPCMSSQRETENSSEKCELSVPTSPRVKAVLNIRCGCCWVLRWLVQAQYSCTVVHSVCLSCKELSYPRKRRFGWQISSAEAVVIFMKGHETQTSARQPVPVQAPAWLNRKIWSCISVHVQSITCPCKAKDGLLSSGWLAWEICNISGRDKFPLSHLHFTLVR